MQVIAVTHAPQVAARADRHYLITKDALAKGKRVATRVSELAAERRREEIARMLAGAEITAEARAAAERLISGGGVGLRHSAAAVRLVANARSQRLERERIECVDGRL